MKIHRISIVIASCAVLLGLAGMAPFAYSYISEQLATPNTGASVALPPQKPRAKKPVAISGKPIRIQIPSLKIDLAVIDGTYDANTGKWTLTKDKVQFATPSVQPNNKSGNTLIYGHATKPVFESLHTIPANAKVIIYTSNGHRLVYRYQNRSDVIDPSNTDIFTYKGKPRLTLQTCTGFWFENRQFFYFTLVDAK
jgi:LPXTG-site transpeptidase (sortase) family protein